MLRNYLTTTFRMLRRYRGYTVINVVGLALGMTACLLIGLYIRDELSYDRFHEDADALFMLGRLESTVTPFPLGAAVAELPNVEQAVRLTWASPTPVKDVATGREREERVLLADPPFFEAFTFPLLQGNPASVLAAPSGAVVTASAARRLFGDADPVGQTLEIERLGETVTVTVTGVAEDVPPNSTIDFDVVASLELQPAQYRRPDSWGAIMYRTYVRLHDPGDAAAFTDRMRAAIRPHLRTSEEADAYFAVSLPEYYLSDYYRTGGFSGQVRYVYVFGAVAVFILLIAAINYVNLVTALAGRRAKEVGVRKTMGADRRQLARQFLGESFVLSALALVIAIALVSVALPLFNGMFDKTLTLILRRDGLVLAALGAFGVAVGVAAGAYPAFVLSRYEPVTVLRKAQGGGGGGWLRRGLVVVQFAISAVLLVGTLSVYGQLQYMQGKQLGFAGEQVAVVDLPRQVQGELLDAVRADVLAASAVVDATVADALPGGFRVTIGSTPASVSPRARTEEETLLFRPSRVDPGYIPALGLELLAGRNFDAMRPSDVGGAYVLNRTAVESLGWTVEEAIGMPFSFGAGPGEVIGVVEDFHLASLRDPIVPVILLLQAEGFSSDADVLAARLAPDAFRDGLDHLETIVAKYAPGEPFVYHFLDDDFDAMYRNEERLGQIFTTFALVAMLIACLGLFGLAAFTAEQRTKEIGIRKVLGASVSSIVLLLSREFTLLVGVALAVGTPVGYVLMDRWLADFAYRIELGPGVFMIAGGVALAVALLAVSGQSLRAALTDPVDALRYE